jgi:hypothetical protein
VAGTIPAGSTGTISDTCCGVPGPIPENQWTIGLNSSAVATGVPGGMSSNGWGVTPISFGNDPSCNPGGGGGYNPYSGSASVTVPSDAVVSTGYAVTYLSTNLSFGIGFAVVAPTGSPPGPGPGTGPC